MVRELFYKHNITNMIKYIKVVPGRPTAYVQFISWETASEALKKLRHIGDLKIGNNTVAVNFSLYFNFYTFCS